MGRHQAPFFLSHFQRSPEKVCTQLACWLKNPWDNEAMHLPLRRCTLRDWTPDDRASLVRFANNIAIARNMRDRFPFPYTESDADYFFAYCERMSPRSYFAIAVGDEAIGGIGITLHEDIERVSGELGYWLGEPFWGRGIASEAVAALTDWAFASWPLTRVYAVPFATNGASARVLEKAGYTLEGRMRKSAIKNNQVLDQLMYAYVR
jgi:RimJ/RimL family protein N-acetyltransferase